MSHLNENSDIWQAKYIKYKTKYEMLKKQHGSGFDFLTKLKKPFGPKNESPELKGLEIAGEKLKGELKELGTKKSHLKDLISKFEAAKKEFDNVTAKIQGEGIFGKVNVDIKLLSEEKTTEYESLRRQLSTNINIGKEDLNKIISLLKDDITALTTLIQEIGKVEIINSFEKLVQISKI